MNTAEGSERIIAIGDGDVDPDRRFEVFYESERAAAIGVALAMTGSVEAAQEIAQETLLSAYREWNRVEHLDKPGAWVRRGAINRSISWQRRLRTEREFLRSWGRRGPVTNESPPTTADFWVVVRTLTKRQQAVVVLRYVSDLPVSEIAVVLEIAEGTVKATLHQARRKLARQLNLTTGHDDG